MKRKRLSTACHRAGWSRRRGLRSRLVMLVLAAVLPLMLFSVGMILLFVREDRRVTERGMRDTARALALAMDREVAEARAALGVLTLSRPLAAGDFQGFYQQCLEALRLLPYDAWLTLSDLQGQMHLNTRVPYGTPLSMTAALDVVQHVAATGRPSNSDLVISGVTNQPVITLDVPVFRDGQVHAVLSLIRPAATLGRLFDEQRLRPGWIAALDDRQHRILVRSRDPERFIGVLATPRLVAHSTAADEGWFLNISLDGTPIYIAFSRVLSTGWTMVLFAPTAVVDAPGRRTLGLLVSGGLVLSAVAVGWALWLGRRIAAPIQGLVPATQALAQGLPVPLAPGTVQEVQEVSVALHDAAALLQQRETSLQEQRAQLHITLASIGDAVIATDSEGRVTFLNPVAAALTGWTEAAALGQDITAVFRIINESTRTTVESPVARVLSEGTVVGLANHTLLIARDGTEIPIDDSGAPIRDQAGTSLGTVLVFRDITERRRAEETRHLLASIVESSEDAIISQDLHGVITSWNRGAERLYGYTAAEAIGRPITIIAAPGRADEMPEMLERIKQGQWLDHYETVRRTKDGRLLHVSLTLSPVYDASGRIVGASKVARDITERVRTEEVLMRNANHLARANADLQQFAYAASHDLQEPLRTVVTFSQLLAHRYHGQFDADADQFIDYIVASATRMNALISDLLDYARVVNVADLPLTDVVLHETVEWAIDNLQLAIQESQARIDVAPLPTIRGEKGQMVQLFQNLLSNAIKYHGHDTPVIRITAEQHAAQWIISVQDNGVGVPPEYHDYIFGVFKRLHGRDAPGTGVGLALCKHIVERLGGRIWVESQPGHGATFKFSLPN